MKLKNIPLLVFWIVMISLGSCARQGVPTGGPKDTIPPTLINMKPKLETVNFDSDEILLEFNEYIEARSLKQDIIINPPVKEYDFYVNRRSVVIELNEDLQENTTYTFNFRNAIKDISEQNPAANIVMAFSTGDKIDSFQVQGQVRDLLTNQPVDDALIALYPEGDTLNPFEDPPTYLTKTNKEGIYAIRYIRLGSYKIFTYTDKNNNLILDSNTESFGFDATPVALIPEETKEMPLPDSLRNMLGDSSAVKLRNLYGKTVNLQMLQQDVRPIVLQSARPNGKYFELKTNKALVDYDLIVNEEDLEDKSKVYIDSLAPDLPRDSIQYVYSNFQQEQKTIRIYNTINQDSLRVYVTLKDSVEQEIKDTLYIKFTETRRNTEELTQNFSSKSEIKNLISAKIKFNKPITKINTDSVLLSYDTLFYLPLNYDALIQWNKTYDEVSIETQINKTQLLDSIISYQQKRGQAEFIQRQAQNQLYLDSLQSAETVEQKMTYFEILARSLPSLQSLGDSINTLESEDTKSQILSELADTLQLEQDYQPKKYDREELTNSLSPLVLYIAGGSFMSIENDSSQQIIQRFSFKIPSEYGTITGNVNTSHESYTIQLLDSKYQVVAETKPTRDKYTFELIPPGSYHLRILVDKNQNGEWERGSILENTNSEPVYFYTEEDVIELRANWNREIDLDF